MTWYEKYQPTPFDTNPIEGLYYLNGGILGHMYDGVFTKGKKFPLIIFPSGLGLELREDTEQNKFTVHLFEGIDLPLHTNRDAAYYYSVPIVEKTGKLVTKIGETQLVIVGYELNEFLLLTYDNTAERLINVEVSQIPQIDE